MKREELEVVLDEVGQVVDRLREIQRRELEQMREECRALRADLSLLRGDLTAIRAELPELVQRAVAFAVTAQSPIDQVAAMKAVGLAVPVLRGYWSQETAYFPGDRVIRQGEWSALKPSLGNDPLTEAESEAPVWLKVGGKSSRTLNLKHVGNGVITENGHEVGDFRPVFAELVDEALEKITARAVKDAA